MARPAEELLAEIGKLLEDLSDKPPTSHGASVCETLTDDHHRIRNLLVPLRELELSGRVAEPSLRQLELLSRLHDSGATELPADCEVPVCASWRDLVEARTACVRCGRWTLPRSRGYAKACDVDRIGSAIVCRSVPATNC
ncbi:MULTISPECIES: hypothetical protein [unclassified Burkholderia]|uniref:hypothetical protein n=1 Tax=unclassified Burkholderia TaxID=2613784 RepID=UPI000F5877BD|nr:MULTISPECIES: hypothetical protein [unclassified Burkholderia]